MWWRIVAWFSALALVLTFIVSGCTPDWGEALCVPGDQGCDDPTVTADAVCSDVCVEEPDDGFTGPNWYWLGPPESMPKTCPPDAPFGGIQAYADSSPEIEPPCAAAQAVIWGFIARECKITTRPTCELQGMTCAAAPPEGYSLCIYQDDEAECPHAYRRTYHLLREQPEGSCAGLGVERITLCCAVPDEAG